MGDRKAALQGASSRSVPLDRAPLRPGSGFFVRARSLTLCSDVILHPPLGMCGMRIAAHFREAPASGGSRLPIEEVA